MRKKLNKDELDFIKDNLVNIVLRNCLKIDTQSTVLRKGLELE